MSTATLKGTRVQNSYLYFKIIWQIWLTKTELLGSKVECDELLNLKTGFDVCIFLSAWKFSANNF